VRMARSQGLPIDVNGALYGTTTSTLFKLRIL
jgi:hypothetical protein